MSRATEIYPYRKAILSVREKIKKDQHNAATLERYYSARVAEGISPARIHKCLCTMSKISKVFGMQFEQATKDDIVRLVASLESEDLADWTKRDYRVVLKHFYKWLRNWEDGTPPEVRWIKKTRGAENKRPILPKDLLTLEEKLALLKATRHPRDRALLEVLMESGRRLGEILTMHIGDIGFDEEGAILSIHGKIGSDFSKIISSAPALAVWLNQHPLRDDPHAPVWVDIVGKNRNRQMPYSGATTMLRNRAKEAGIKKRIHFYLFRHTRIDESQGLLKESEQCNMFGWRYGSHMPATYMKRSIKHIGNAQRIMNGLVPGANPTAEQKSKRCIRCSTVHSVASKFCMNCGMPLDLKFSDFDQQIMIQSH